MAKMYLTTSAESFMAYRLSIAGWLLANKIPVEIHLWSTTQKVRWLFENTNDAWSFQEEFEGM